MTITLPLRLVSVLNTREHWAKRAKRAKEQRWIVSATLQAKRRNAAFVSPVVITITRVAPRQLDTHDNLRASAKAVVDGIADWLHVRDNDRHLEWRYAQERGKPREYAVRIEIT